jgi:hypothetical protein
VQRHIQKAIFTFQQVVNMAELIEITGTPYNALTRGSSKPIQAAHALEKTYT